MSTFKGYQINSFEPSFAFLSIPPPIQWKAIVTLDKQNHAKPFHSLQKLTKMASKFTNIVRNRVFFLCFGKLCWNRLKSVGKYIIVALLVLYNKSASLRTQNLVSVKYFPVPQFCRFWSVFLSPTAQEYSHSFVRIGTQNHNKEFSHLHTSTEH